MSLLQAVVLGAVQGLTEFVPISSSGHLVIVPELFGWDPPGLAFDVLLHSASLLALLIYFSGDLIDLVRGALARDRDATRLATLLVVGTIPAAILGLAFADYFEGTFDDARAAAVQLIMSGVILIAAERVLAHHEQHRSHTGRDLRRMEDLRVPDALLVGAAQAAAIFPGISRSGATIGAGLSVAVAREAAARFAFLLAIPALLGATLVEVPQLRGSALGAGAGLAGFLSSLLVSYAAIAALIKYLRANSLYPFAAYCLIAGAAFFALV